MKRITVIALIMFFSLFPNVVAASTDVSVNYERIVDLSHLVEADMPVDPSLKLPELSFFGRIGNGGQHNLEVISYCPHTGTHMDAPYHVIEDAGAIETWPADILIGPAVVVSVGRPGNYAITKADIENWEKLNGPIKKGDAVLFHSGHDANWAKGYKAYIAEGYTHLTPEAAQYLAAKGIRYMAIESISPDTDSVSAHQILMKNGIPIIENICNLGEIGQTRCTTIGTFPAVKGATGVWVRLLAIL